MSVDFRHRSATVRFWPPSRKVASDCEKTREKPKMYIKSLLILPILFASLLAKEIPEYLHICKRNDPNVQKCFRQSVLFLKPYLARGIPELKIPSIEPLTLKDPLILNPTTGRNAGLQISASDIDVYGCTDFDVSNLNVDFDGNKITFDLKLKHLYIDGTYHVDGRILLLPVKGSGKVVGNFTNCLGAVEMESRLVQRNGQEYLKMNSMRLKVNVGKGSIHLYDLFRGDRLLGDVINNAINSNFDTLSREIFPALEKELSKLFLRLSNNIVSQYTFDQLFPDN